MYIFPEQLPLHSTSELYINYKMEYSLSTKHDLLSKSPEWRTGKKLLCSLHFTLLRLKKEKKSFKKGILFVLHIFLGLGFGVCVSTNKVKLS